MLLKNKPEASIQKIISHISHPDNIVQISSGSYLSLNSSVEPDSFIIHEGVALLRRTHNRQVITTLQAPIIGGFNQFMNLGNEAFIETVTPVAVEILPVSAFYEGIMTHQLWEPLHEVMMFIGSLSFFINSQLSFKNASSVVHLHLAALNNEIEPIKTRITVFDYIQQRSHLSKNSIDKHLLDLRRKGTLRIKNGYLQSYSATPGEEA